MTLNIKASHKVLWLYYYTHKMPSRIMHWWPHNPTIPQIQFDPVTFKQIQCAISTKWGAKNYILITNLACKEMCLGVIIWASNRSTYVQTHNFPPNDEQRIILLITNLACKEMHCFPRLIWASNRPNLSNPISNKWQAKNHIPITKLACKQMCLGLNDSELQTWDPFVQSQDFHQMIEQICLRREWKLFARTRIMSLQALYKSGANYKS